MERIYRWRSAQGTGLEHLSLQYREDVIVADGIVVGDDEGRAFGCCYRICCDTAWRVRSVEVRAAGAESRVLTTDGDGHWRDGDGLAQPQLGGCIDVDISATPFTNTLPIRRIGAALAQRTTIQVAYIRIPELAIKRAEQAYTRLPGQRYLFEALASGFRSEIAVDEDGLVWHYPGLFDRLPGN